MDRASAALANIQRSAYAMGMLRSRIEARINDGGGTNDSPELAKILQLVKTAELLLKEMSTKAESARFLEDFIRIINGASDSVGEIKGDVQELVPMAETALAQMHDAVSDITIALSPPATMKEEIDPSILAQVSAEIAAITITEPPPAGLSAGTKDVKKERAGIAPEEKENQLEEVAI